MGQIDTRENGRRRGRGAGVWAVALTLGVVGALPAGASPGPEVLVTNTNDTGAGSLRSAIHFANAHPAP